MYAHILQAHKHTWPLTAGLLQGWAGKKPPELPPAGGNERAIFKLLFLPGFSGLFPDSHPGSASTFSTDKQLSTAHSSWPQASHPSLSPCTLSFAPTLPLPVFSWAFSTFLLHFELLIHFLRSCPHTCSTNSNSKSGYTLIPGLVLGTSPSPYKFKLHHTNFTCSLFLPSPFPLLVSVLVFLSSDIPDSPITTPVKSGSSCKLSLGTMHKCWMGEEETGSLESPRT